jgi:hypothetical protein
MSYYKTNEPDVSAELLDNEVLIVNLKTGRYYSVHDTGVTFWRLLSDGHSMESAIDKVSEMYAVDATIVKADFSTFVDTLLKNELIVEIATPKSASDSEWLTELSGTYSQALIEQYTDMENLVLLY